jgi:hypothetical protein
VGNVCFTVSFGEMFFTFSLSSPSSVCLEDVSTDEIDAIGFPSQTTVYDFVRYPMELKISENVLTASGVLAIFPRFSPSRKM